MDRPSDLVSLRDAAMMIERSPRTLRRWIKDGRLDRFEGPTPDNGGSSVALVSKGAVLALAAVTNQQPRVDGSAEVDSQPDPSPTPRPDVVDKGVDPSLEVLTLRAELERVKLAGELAKVQAERDALALRLEEADRRLRDETADLRAARDDWQGRHDAVRAELDALRRSVAERGGVPWWRRLIGGPVAELPGEVPQAK